MLCVCMRLSTDHSSTLICSQQCCTDSNTMPAAGETEHIIMMMVDREANDRALWKPVGGGKKQQAIDGKMIYVTQNNEPF